MLTAYLISFAFFLLLIDLRLGPVTSNILALALFPLILVLKYRDKIPLKFISVVILVATFATIVLSAFHLNHKLDWEIWWSVRLYLVILLCGLMSYFFIEERDQQVFSMVVLTGGFLCVAYIGWISGFQIGKFILLRSLLVQEGLPVNNTVINFALIALLAAWCFRFEAKHPFRLLFIPLILLSAAIVMASASRQSALILIIGCSFVLSFRKVTLVALAITAVAIVVDTAIFEAYFSKFIERVSVLTLPGSLSQSARTLQYELAWDNFSSAPLLGNGLAAFQIAGGQAGLTSNEMVTESSLSHLVVVSGFLGLLLFLMVFVFPLYLTFFAVHDSKSDPWRRLFMALAAVNFLGGLFNESLFNSGPWLTLFVTILYSNKLAGLARPFAGRVG